MNNFSGHVYGTTIGFDGVDKLWLRMIMCMDKLFFLPLLCGFLTVFCCKTVRNSVRMHQQADRQELPSGNDSCRLTDSKEGLSLTTDSCREVPVGWPSEITFLTVFSCFLTVFSCFLTVFGRQEWSLSGRNSLVAQLLVSNGFTCCVSSYWGWNTSSKWGWWNFWCHKLW